MKMRRVIVDVDVGADDYLALVCLIHAEMRSELKIEAIICTNGNTEVENVIVNVVRLLEVMERTDIPVYKGAKHQLILSNEKRLKFHGQDGFADLKLAHTPNISIIGDKPGAVAIHDIVMGYPKEVSLICIGPLTNLALSIKLFDDLASNIKDVWIMGGNFTGVGNVSSTAEFNFYMDPEAAYIVLENIKCPIFIFPWETCLIPKISMKWRTEVLGNLSPELSLLTQAESVIYKNDEDWITCDTYLAFCYLNPAKHITKSSKHHMSVELHGGLTRGQVVLDHMKNNQPNVTIIENIDKDIFIKELLKLKR